MDKVSKLENFMHDKTSLVLLIVLMFVIGVTISQLIFKIDFAQIAKNADGLTKEEAASQYAQREKAKIKQNGTDVILIGPSLNVISIQLSKTCLYIAKQNMTSACPSYKDLVKYDTTDQRYLGKFVEKPYYHRGKPLMTNPSITLKTLTDTIICVDCPYDVFTRSKVITITNNKLTYTKDSDKKIINNTRYEYIGRSIDNCAFATIYYNKLLLEDTINYLKSGCTETYFDEKITIQPELTKHDIKTSKAWKYAEWLKAAKKISKTENCIKSTKC